ncbi:I78 family peptidase inhibitor [Novosphingobium huizhouense]|uniref:I78 family peptidase inhibitor n=1 Tax=Novosphingobium huizhouense TaxID=2866625 RepID=UPI001CD8BF4B|nr:I78 family peptidase inhibitor [Novosphingobium huizhouense]
MVRFPGRSIGAALLCLLAVGCHRGAAGEAPGEPVLPAVRAPVSSADPCAAGQLAVLLQHVPGPRTRAAVERFAAPAPVRWVRPGAAVTPDYRAERLNLILDEDERIAALRCG